MRKTIVASTLALAALGLSSEAQAAGWGLHSGDTVRSGDNMIYGEVGWPSLGLGIQHGMSDKVDLGFRFDLIYGAEYTRYTHLGLGMRVPIRIAAVKKSNFSFLIHLDPGIKFDSIGGNCGYYGYNGYYGGCGLEFGIWLPFGLEFGIHFNREATLQFGVEMPIHINLANNVYGQIPILFGPGFEYAIDDHMAVGLNLKFGPSILAVNNGSAADFGFITQIYFAYRL